MSWSSFRMLMTAGFLLSAWPGGAQWAAAQEPSASLKQADADYREGTSALARNDLNAALADFQNVVRLAPAAEQGHSALGAVLVRLGRMSEGIHELERALDLQPGDSAAQLNLALAYEQGGEAAGLAVRESGGATINERRRR